MALGRVGSDMDKVYIDRDLLLEAAKATNAYFQIKSIVSGLPEALVPPARGRRRKLYEDNERLSKQLRELSWKCSGLSEMRRIHEEKIKELQAKVSGEREKYSALLEKYISMMEARVQNE